MKALDEYFPMVVFTLLLNRVVTPGYFVVQLVSQHVALQLHEQGRLHCAMGLAETHKTATEEDRGEDNKDPDWLIEQSTVRQVAGGGLHCATLKQTLPHIIAESRIKFYFLHCLQQQHNCKTSCMTSSFMRAPVDSSDFSH